MTNRQREFMKAEAALKDGTAAKPTCRLGKWVSPKDGSVRLYINSKEIPFGVKLWLDTQGMVEGYWRVVCKVEWMCDKNAHIDLGYELLANTFGREFATTATWTQMLEKAA